MADNVNLSINGQSQVPPGFRFHPTEEELLHYYLRKKVCYEKIDLDVIREVDLNKLEPWDIQEKCRIGSTPQNDWYFFSHKDKKYPTGTRTNRATAAGFWKATGRDKIIYSGVTRIGLRKTLVFYKGRAPHGQKSDWIMHEYRLDDNSIILTTHDSDALMADSAANCNNEEGWVVCRVFKKKNYQKIVDDGPNKLGVHMDQTQTLNNRENNNGVLDQILLYMGRSGSNTTTCMSEDQTLNTTNNMGIMSTHDDNQQAMFHERFMHLPHLETVLPKFETPNDDDSSSMDRLVQRYASMQTIPSKSSRSEIQNFNINNWASLERLVAWQLDNSSNHKSYDHQVFEEDGNTQGWNQNWNVNEDMDIWSSLTESSSSPSSLNPLGHLSI